MDESDANRPASVDGLASENENNPSSNGSRSDPSPSHPFSDYLDRFHHALAPSRGLLLVPGRRFAPNHVENSFGQNPSNRTPVGWIHSLADHYPYHGPCALCDALGRVEENCRRILRDVVSTKEKAI